MSSLSPPVTPSVILDETNGLPIPATSAPVDSGLATTSKDHS